MVGHTFTPGRILNSTPLTTFFLHPRGRSRDNDTILSPAHELCMNCLAGSGTVDLSNGWRWPCARSFHGRWDRLVIAWMMTAFAA
jgi:hypothetical protein